MLFFRKKTFFGLLLLTIGFFLFISSKPVFAQAIIYQNYFRWYVNTNAVDPTDPWPPTPPGGDLAELAPITLSDSPPAQGTVLRIRMSLYVDPASPAPINPGDQFKLQYGEKTGASCSGISSWTDLDSPGNCNSAWCGYNNLTPNDGDPITPPGLLSVTDAVETYEEANNAITAQPVNPDQDGEWDWVIYNNSATPNTSYCFRMVNGPGTELDGYNYYPELITQAITVSGTVYTDEGSTPIGANRTVVIKVNGADKCNGTSICTAETDINGVYSISNLDIDAANDVLTVFLDNETEKAVTVTKAKDTTSNITGLDLYQNRVILRHEGTTSITNNDLGQYDKDNDLDIHFTSNTGSLTVDNDHELHLWTGKTFSPGGSVTISPGGTSPGGDLHIDDNAVFTAGGAISVGGNWTADTGSTFTHNNNTVTFTATAIGKTITTNSQPFANLEFNGSGGGWSFSQVTTISNNLTITAGTLSGTSNITVNGGAVTGDGVINLTGGTFTLTGTGNFGGNTKWTFYNLTFGDGFVSGTTTSFGSGTIEINQVLTINSSHILDAGSKTWTLAGATGTPFVINGTFTANSSTFTYTGNNISGDTTIASTTYNNLTLNNASETYVLAGATSLNGDLNITNGVLDVTVTNHALNVKGSWSNSGTFQARNGTVTFNGTSAGKTIDPGLSPFYNLTFNGSGGEWTLSTNNLDVNNDLNITAGTLSASTLNINLAGNLFIGANGIFIKGTGTFTFDTDTTASWTDNSSGQDLGTVVISGTISKTVNLTSSVKTSKITITAADTLNLGSSYTLTLTGSGTGVNKPLTVNGTLTPGNSTIEYTGGASTDVTLVSNYYNLTLNGTGPFTAETGDLTIDNNLNVTTGTFNLGGGTTVGNDLTIGSNGTLDVTTNNYSLTVGGSWTNSGGLFAARSGQVTFSSSGAETITTNSQPFYDLTFGNATGSWTLQDALDVDHSFDLSGSLTQAPNANINFGGAVIFNGTFNKATGSGLVIFDGTNAYFQDNNLDKQNLGNVHVGTSPDDLTLCTGMKMDSLTINSNDILYLNGYNLDVTNGITVNSNATLDSSSSRDAICPTGPAGNFINLGGNWTIDPLGSFLAGSSTVIFDESTNANLSSGGTNDNHDFNNLTIQKSAAATVTLANYDLDVSGNLNIANINSTLDVSTSNYHINVGGNWSNSGTFTARAGTVTFDAGSTGKTIDSGGTGSGKDFYNIVFDNAAGGWTIQTNNLTATNDFSITNAASFTSTVNLTANNNFTLTAATSFDVTNTTVTVNGNFTNLVGGAATTWTGSTLVLTKTGGGSYTINTKTAGGDFYAKIQVGANTDIRMWNSKATNYVIDSTGSLYSMDHAEVDGELYIWGDYHTTSGQTDYWNYDTDFDGTPLGASSRQVKVYLQIAGTTNPSVTVDNGGTLNVKGGGSTVNDITIVGQDASALWNFACSGTCNVQESTWNYLNLAAGTLTVYNTTLNNEDAPDIGATLNVDWYLGDYVVDRVSLSPIDTAADDIIISENSATPASTVWKWSGGGWGTPSTSQTTGTGADGKIPQPGTDGAIRIREYSRTLAGYTFYKYNLYIDWQGATYGEYDYYLGYGHKYITSTLNTGSGEDECISESWVRYDIDAQNTPTQAIDEPPTNGTWYNGMISGLSFSIDDYSIDFGNLIPGGDPTDQTNTLTVSTSASNGYVCYIFSTQEMTKEGGSETISDWSGTNESPTEWPTGSYGFGYSTNDYDLTGGAPNRFEGPKFAGFTHNGSESKPVADRGEPSVNQQNTITYRLAVPSTQTPGTYTTTIIFLIIPNY